MNTESEKEEERNKYFIKNAEKYYRHDVYQNIFAKAKLVSFSAAYINQFNIDNTFFYNNLTFGARSEIISIHSKITKRDYYTAFVDYKNKVVKTNTLNPTFVKEYYINSILPNLEPQEQISIHQILTQNSKENIVEIVRNYFEDDICEYIWYKAYYTLLYENSIYEEDYIETLRQCEIFSQYLDVLDNETIADSTLTYINTIKEILERKPLFRLEAAGAVSSFFGNSSFNSINFGRSGFWLTAEYNYKPYSKASRIKYISLLGIERILYNPFKSDLFPDFDNNTIVNDLGARAILELEKFNIGIEGIWRYNITQNNSTYRLSGSVGFTVSPKIHLTAAFGKNFGNENNIITVMGLDWKFLQSLLNINTSNFTND